MQIFFFGRNNRFIFNIIEVVLFRPKLYLVLEYQLSTDDFSVSNTTQGDTPSSFALGYQYFAHTGLNPNLHCKEFRTTVIKLPFFRFAANLDPSECEGRQNARLRVRFDEIFASFSSNGKGRASPA